MPRVASTSRMCSERTSQSLEERRLARRDGVAVGLGAPRERRLARPDERRSCRTPCRSRRPPRRSGRSRRCRASCRAACCRRRSASCPALQRGHLLRNLAHRGEHQRPGQLGGRIGRRARVLARRDDDAEPRAGVDVDVRIDAALADQPELGQPLEQRRADLACARGSAPALRCRAAARPARRRPGRGRSRS